MMQASGFFPLPQEIAGSGAGTDRFGYRLVIEEDGEGDGRRHTVDVGEAAVPPELRPLLEWLTAEARRTQRRG